MTENDMHHTVLDHIRVARERYVDERFKQLNGLITTNADGAWTYLMNVNGGGVAAVLTYLAAFKDDLVSKSLPLIALIVFMIGLVLVGAGRAVIVHKTNDLLMNWRNNTISYYQLQSTWSMLISRDQQIVERYALLPWILGWMSLICFLIGVSLSAWLLLSS